MYSEKVTKIPVEKDREVENHRGSERTTSMGRSHLVVRLTACQERIVVELVQNT